MTTNRTARALATITGTNPLTGRPKRARGTGVVVRVEENMGFHGTVTVVRWTNGVESYHCANLDNSDVAFA